jgi:hypothetical protein
MSSSFLLPRLHRDRDGLVRDLFYWSSSSDAEYILSLATLFRVAFHGDHDHDDQAGGGGEHDKGKEGHYK